VAFAAFLCLFLVFGALGWPGEPDSCTLGGNCYCETAHATPSHSIVKQPANTWSNLGAVLAGLLILAIADRERARRRGGARSAPNPMMSGGFYAVLYGAVVLFLGPGSMAFHGSLTRFGGWLDTLSMILFITFVLLYDAARILRFDDRRTVFAGAYLSLNALLAVFTWVAYGSGMIVFVGAVAVAVILELVLSTRGIGGVRRPLLPWLTLGLVTFAIALVVWWLSWTGGLLCDPDSLFQGHAVWHVLAEAVAPVCFFLHFRAEQRVPDGRPDEDVAGSARKAD
jgi:hypothetical protein